MPGIPGLQGPAGPKGIYDPNLDEEGRPGAEGIQGPIGNKLKCYLTIASTK